jgi:hypothetical protein
MLGPETLMVPKRYTASGPTGRTIAACRGVGDVFEETAFGGADRQLGGVPRTLARAACHRERIMNSIAMRSEEIAAGIVARDDVMTEIPGAFTRRMTGLRSLGPHEALASDEG